MDTMMSFTMHKDEDKVSAIFTFFGEGRKSELSSEDHDMIPSIMILQDKGESEITTEEIMWDGIELSIEDYNNETGILKIGFSPEVPIWTLNNFAGYFIPVFKNEEDE